MSSTTFTDEVTPIVSTWLNDVDQSIYVTVPQNTSDIAAEIARATAAESSVTASYIAADAVVAANFASADAAITVAYLAADQADRDALAVSSGSALVGTTQAGTGAVARTVQSKLRESISVKDFGAVGDGLTDDTAAIQAAIDAHSHVYIPVGIYLIDADVGVALKTGSVLTGDGKNKTILSAIEGTGGSLAELAAYTKGSVLKRSFNPAGPNSYVNDIYISGVGVVLNHPVVSITATKIQIGFDFRNITGSTIINCHCGNIPPVGGALPVKVAAKPFLVQGYPFVFGNVSGGSLAYAGGEKNKLLDSSIYGGYKCVIQDDPALSGASAAYATIIRGNDIQTGQWLVGQMGQFSAGNVHIDNILQDIQVQDGSVDPTYLQYYGGFNNIVRPTYIEGGSNVDFLLYLASTANNNRIDLTMCSYTSGAGAITDASSGNTFNLITHFGGTGVGKFVELYNKANRRSWVKFHYDGAAIVIDGSDGVSGVSRTGTGDYTITWETPYIVSNYALNFAIDTNASVHGGTTSIRSHSTANVRIATYAQNGGTSTPIDPRFVWVESNQ